MVHLLSHLSYTSCDVNKKQIHVLGYMVVQYGRHLASGPIFYVII